MSEFQKNDKGKPRPDLIPSGFLLEMGAVMAHGAATYGDYNWQKCEDPSRYYAAAYRHMLQSSQAPLDEETGYTHLAHAACSLAIAWALDAINGT